MSSDPNKHNETINSAQTLKELREISRREYLQKREEQQLLLLQQKLADEKELFGKDRLTKNERREFEYQSQLLSILEEKQRLEKQHSTRGYEMPQDYLDEKDRLEKRKKKGALYKRYRKYEDGSDDDADDSLLRVKSQKLSEQERWEKTKLEQSGVKLVQDADEEAEFEFVFDENEHVEFVLESTLAGEENPREQTLKQTPSDVARVYATEKERQRAKIRDTRRSLPMFEYRDEFLAALQEHSVLIVVGETGSGKTTQLPQYLFEDGYCAEGKKIGCTQPRRVAAMSVAARVSEEMDVKLGSEVGYSIRFEDCTSDKTLIKYMTDGMLLREFLVEPDLASYSVVIIDEAHERTLHTDILLALVKDLARYRSDFRVVISSATMDALKFSAYFDDAPIFNVPGRRFPVDIYYAKAPEADYLAAAIRTIFQIHLTQAKGDILVFLTGADEIQSCIENLQHICRQLGSRMRELVLCPCYSALPADLQAKIFEPTPPRARKVVLATNIAETSITIEGISFVIDPGFVKQTFYEARTNMETLQVVPCSKASANQRAGRAGRVGPGKCFRLFTAWSFDNELEASTQPEIQRTALTSVVLMLKSLGIDDLLNFDFIDAPSSEGLVRALEQLYALGALNAKGELTRIGHRMAEFPVDPMMAKMLIVSEEYDCTTEVLAIAAMLSVSSMLFYRPRDKAIQADKMRMEFSRPGGDHMLLLAVWDSWLENGYSAQWCFDHFIQFRSMKRARDVRDQLAKLCERVGITVKSEDEDGSSASDPVKIRQCITAGYFYHAARLGKSGDHYKAAKFPQKIYIHPSSSLTNDRPKWLVYYELVLTKKEYMRQVLEISPSWLLQVAPHYFKEADLLSDIEKRIPRSM